MAEAYAERTVANLAFHSVLPKAYQSEDHQGVESYLQDTVQLLSQYQSLYDFQLTRIFVDNVLKSFPDEWQSVFSDLEVAELNQIPYGLHKETWPSSLQTLITKSIQLYLPRDQQCVPSIQLSNAQKKGMNPKKIHEVSSLAALIHSTCEENRCVDIVDIGSGLGYLSLVLCQNYGYRVIGLENQNSRSHGAERRAIKSEVCSANFKPMTFQLDESPRCFSEFNEVLYQTFQSDKWLETVDQDSKDGSTHRSAKTVNKFINDCSDIDMNKSCKSLNHQFNMDAANQGIQNTNKYSVGDNRTNKNNSAEANVKVCMLGLHCCGDLTPTMLRLLHSSPNISCLVCISCCYHRMAENGTGSAINNFPMSSKLREYMSKTSQRWSMGQYALRLAAQETRTRWSSQTMDDHARHKRNVAYRGLLELGLIECDQELVRESRTLANRKDMDNFETYVESVIERTKLKGEDGTQLRTVLQRLYDEYSGYFQLIEPLTCIQVLLQPVLETLLTIDRLWYLMENNISATTMCVFNENISPRNIAVIAAKA